ncbi:hypothetical protein ACQKWADRAFT_324968 [Trichoderma austrokoningii]
MKLSFILVFITLGVTSSQGHYVPLIDPEIRDKQNLGCLVEDIQAKVLKFLDYREAELHARNQSAQCTAKSIVFRREYGSLTKAERLDYIKAVKCLQNLPPHSPASVVPGARSRYDDFLAAHIQHTLSIHLTGNFLPWHRWLIHEYERALREECGYTGYQPYWDWPKYASAPEKSPIFNGDPYSLGGNGDFIPHDGRFRKTTNNLPIAGIGMYVPPGLGGGFVTTGPFANMTVNLGPLDSLAYNPRRFKRDIGPSHNMRFANYTTILNILQQPNIAEFRYQLEGVPYSNVTVGPHIAGHTTIGGDPGADIYASPGDPAFYVHHGNVDRMWTLWQANDPEKRHNKLGGEEYGHVTWANTPPSRVTMLSDLIDLGYAGNSIKIVDVMDTLSGPLCYFYL